MRERDIQDAFEHWLREREIPFLRSRMDKRPTIRKGWPDFTIFWCGRVVMVETKTETGKLSKDQKDCIAFLQKNGCRVEIARSVEQCCEVARGILTESGRATDASKRFPDAIREQFKKTKEIVAAVGTNDEPPADFGKMEPTAEDYGRALMDELKPSPADGKRLFLGDLFGVTKVMFGDPTPGGVAEIVRTATPSDIANLPRR